MIVCEGAVGAVPAAWPAALSVGGRLAVVVREGPVGQVRLYLRSEVETGSRQVFDATPPFLAGMQVEHGFAF